MGWAVMTLCSNIETCVKFGTHQKCVPVHMLQKCKILVSVCSKGFLTSFASYLKIKNYGYITIRY